jgi:hypothetical protein
VTHVVASGYSITQALGPWPGVAQLHVATRLGYYSIEHGVPGPYPPDTFPDLAVAVQMRPALETYREPVPVRARRPNRVQRPWWDYDPATQLLTPRIDIDFGAGWVDVTEDVVSAIKAKWGLAGSSPTDRVAEPGTMAFDLNNSATCSGGVRGYYSPDSPDRRSGFTLGAKVRLVMSHELFGERVQFQGEINRAKPEAGVASPITSVEVVDWMEAAALAPLIGEPVQVNADSHAIFRAIVGAVDAQPPNGIRVIPGSDRYPYALDTAQDESAKAVSELQKLALSEYALIYVEGGEAIFEGRRWRGRPVPDPVFTLDEDEQLLVVALTADDRDLLVNRAQVTAHPRLVDASATTVLFANGAALKIPAGTSITIDCQYRDPSQRSQRVAGLDMQAPVYSLNTLEDGSGRNITASLGVQATFGGSSAKVTLTNTGGADGFVPQGALQLVGRGLYDFQPIMADYIDQESVDLYGENIVQYDMPHQDDPRHADDLARFIVNVFSRPRTLATSVTFLANWNEECAEQLFLRTISDRVAVNAPSAGLIESEYWIDGWAIEVHQSGITHVTWTLGPTDPHRYWQLGVPGRTELGRTTRLGYRFFRGGWVLGIPGYSELGRTTLLVKA